MALSARVYALKACTGGPLNYSLNVVRMALVKHWRSIDIGLYSTLQILDHS